jgi:hypothetical protein
MDVDPRALASGLARNGDIDLRSICRTQLVKSRFGAVGKDGTRAAGDHGCHPVAFAGEELTRDERIDAVVNAV